MNHLPEDVITTIFEHLDNESLFNTLLASKHLADIFASSSRLLLMFNLFVGPATIDIILKNKSIENIPFKNVTLYNFARKISPEMQEFLDKFSHSIEILTFEHIEFESVEDFSLALSHLPNLKSLHLKTCYVDHSEPQILQPISNLKSITFDDCRGSLFPFFKNQQSIEKVSIIRKPWTFGLFYSDFNEMASNLPNLKHLVFGGPKTADYFNYGEYPFKIQTLEAYSVTSSRTESVSKFDFLKSQQESLKELTIQKLPYNYDGGEVLKFIIEEMRLEKFYFGKVPLILDGKKQEVKELTVSEVYLTSAFEMFLQFPSIQSFSLLLTKTDIDEARINDIINHNTDIFKNLNVLNVTDYSGSLNRPSKFIGLYKNFKNIAKLTLKTNCSDLNEILSESLSYFTDLTEINLTAGKENSIERLRIVKDLVPNLKKLGVSKDVVKDAEKVFGEDVDIIRLDDFDGDNYRNEEQIEAFWMREKF